MTLLVRILDKIIFASLLLLALQVPILADHYRQYLSGYFDATANQVASIEALSQQHGFASVQALIEDLKRNPSAVVRDDANVKLETIAALKGINEGLSVLNEGHYYEQAWYMLSPAQNKTLMRVMDNFHPSIPLSVEPVIFSLISAIIINVLLWAPYWTAVRIQRWRHNRRYHANTGAS